jgi:hypothetical protein
MAQVCTYCVFSWSRGLPALERSSRQAGLSHVLGATRKFVGSNLMGLHSPGFALLPQKGRLGTKYRGGAQALGNPRLTLTVLHPSPGNHLELLLAQRKHYNIQYTAPSCLPVNKLI